jgi:1-acyl-sn-glycerol-3-phosphate acyltransferase
MLDFLPAAIRAPLALVLIVANLLAVTPAIFVVAFAKLVVPVASFRRLCTRALLEICWLWNAGNHVIFRLFTRIDWQVEGVEGLRMDRWYLLISNHQSWVDVPVLLRTFHRRIPYLRFFLKQELIWVPIFGVIWWALDYPFMKRYPKHFLEKHPELRGKDREAARRSCERFRSLPATVMNFVEGTRFTPEKHARQGSPYRHLLRPKAGGMAFTTDAMADLLHGIIDVTIIYPDGAPSFVDMLSGKLRRVRVSVVERPIPPDLARGDYDADAAYRERFQAWVSQIWAEKDARIAAG